MKNETKIEVVDTQGACERLKCSRMTLYNKYKDRLVQVPSSGKKNFFTLESVLRIQSEIQDDFLEGKYKIVN